MSEIKRSYIAIESMVPTKLLWTSKPMGRLSQEDRDSYLKKIKELEKILEDEERKLKELTESELSPDF